MQGKLAAAALVLIRQPGGGGKRASRLDLLFALAVRSTIILSLWIPPDQIIDDSHPELPVALSESQGQLSSQSYTEMLSRTLRARGSFPRFPDYSIWLFGVDIP